MNYKFSDLMIDNFEEKVHTPQNKSALDKIRKSSANYSGGT